MLPRPEEDMWPFIQPDVAYTGEQATFMCSCSLYNKLSLCFSGIFESQNIVQRSLFLSLTFYISPPVHIFPLQPPYYTKKPLRRREVLDPVFKIAKRFSDSQKQTN